MADITPTQSALLELKEERGAMSEAYSFLDEKRTLLAGEIVQQLRLYSVARAALDAGWQRAVEALEAAVSWHGLDGLQCYPAVDSEGDRLRISRRSLLGVVLQEADMELIELGADKRASGSPEAEHCRVGFREMTKLAASVAAHSGNLLRLYEEYKRTERRARALEDVLLPEMQETMVQIDAQLEALELEEAVRVRGRRR